MVGDSEGSAVLEASERESHQRNFSERFCVGSWRGGIFSLEVCAGSIFRCAENGTATIWVDVVIVQPGQVKTPIHYKMITGIDADAAGPDAVYGPLMHALTGLLEGGVNSPTDPKEVANVVVEAALSASPKTRYLVGHDIPDWEHLRDLPDRERDAQILSLLGLP